MCRTSGGDLIPTPGISDRQAIDVSGPSNTSPATAPAANPKDTQVTLKITTNQPTCSVCGSHYVTQIVRTTLYDLQHPKKPTDKNHCGWFGFVCDVLGVNSVIDCIQSPSWGSCISAVVSIIGDVLIAGTAIKAGQLARVANGEKLAAADATAGERIAATCGGGSFSPDTRVVMADGSTKPLDRVKVGDKVEATDTTTGKTTAKTVTTLWVNHDTDLMDVTVKAGEKTSLIHATQKHLFWDPVRRAWVQADQLKVGEALRTDNGLTTTVASTAILPGAANMWDLTITNDHDFYIATTTANVLVHNQTCNLPGPGDVPTKVVNSNMGHIDAERAGRAGFTTVRGAQGAVRDLSNSIASHGFPAGTIADTARADRVLVPIVGLS